MDKNFVMTPHRARILAVLLGGDIVDPSGHATPELMKHTGHRTSNALAGVLLQLENAGLVARDMNGRRTYRISLTAKGRKVAERLAQSETPDTYRNEDTYIRGEVSVEGVDLDLLAGVLLKKALLATQAQEDSAGAKTAAARAQRAEAKAAALDAELREARTALAEVQAQVKTLEHNNKVLAGQMDKVRKSPGTPVSELISKAEQRELEKLMRQLPTARG